MKAVVGRLPRKLLNCTLPSTLLTNHNQSTTNAWITSTSRVYSHSTFVCADTGSRGKRDRKTVPKTTSSGSSSKGDKSKPKTNNTFPSSSNQHKDTSTTDININQHAISRLATELTSIFDVYRYGVSLFTKADLSFGHSTMTPWEDASFLILHELHLPYNDPITHWSQAKLTQSEREHLLTMMHRRVDSKKPIAYLVQGCYQQDEYFYIDERALIPRSFIGDILRNRELVRVGGKPTNASKSSVQEALQELDYNDYISEIVDEEKFTQSQQKTTIKTGKLITHKAEEGFLFDHDKIQSVLDLCTGSGCLAILAAKYFPNVTHIDAVDIAADTLEVAEINVEMKGLEELINLHEGDLFQALPKFYAGDVGLEDDVDTDASAVVASNQKRKLEAYHQKYDLIISNPPYVTTEDMQDLPPEYLHEPALALEAGKDGLSVVNKIFQHAYDYLNDNGGLLCEVGQCKPALEKKYKDLFGNAHKHHRVRWIATENAKEEVFYIRKEFLHSKYLK